MRKGGFTDRDDRLVYGLMLMCALVTAAALLLPTHSAAIDPPFGRANERAAAAQKAAMQTSAEGTVAVGDAAGEPIGACCVDEDCPLDTDESGCLAAGGRFNAGASCGPAADLPPPICIQLPCGFDNGGPLADGGAPVSQFAPDEMSSVAAADDFLLEGITTGEFCHVQVLTAWVMHQPMFKVFPQFDYEGVTITIYREAAGGVPAGRPREDGTHVSDETGGIVFSQTIPLDSENVSAVTPSPPCVEEQFRLTIPIDAVLRQEEDTRYWLELQPVLDGKVGRSAWVLSESSNLRRAKRIDAGAASPSWSDIAGNADDCAPDTPPEGTHTDLAFSLVGEPSFFPPNDNCGDSLAVSDGVVAFTNRRLAGSVGPALPSECFVGATGAIDRDIWYEYVASCTGTVAVDVCGSDFDTVLAVYRECGVCPPATTPAACNDDSDFCGLGSFQSRLTFDVTEGECFTVRAGEFQGTGDGGDGLLRIRCQPPPPVVGACCKEGKCLGTIGEAECQDASGEWFEGEVCPEFACPIAPPAHDDCTNPARVRTGVPFHGSNLGATSVCSLTDDISCLTDADCPEGETCLLSQLCAMPRPNDSNDVWHVWEADCTGAATIRLCDTTFDTTLAVYDACGGTELACDDDGCPPSSQLDSLFKSVADVPVVAGREYFIRVGGFLCDEGFCDEGEYTLVVEPCLNPCCRADGLCALNDPDACVEACATPVVGAFNCLGDGNGNKIDDICEGYPPANIAGSFPVDGTLDARQPHEPQSPLLRQGIGTVEEPIVIVLDPPVSGAEGCFELCDTDALSENDIAGVTDLGDGAYEIILTQAIAIGEVTTIRYLGDGSHVAFTSHPANVDGDEAADALDAMAFRDCCINRACDPELGMERCDLDRSGRVTLADGLRAIDMLNGGDEYELRVDRPDSIGCP